jgi:hypothetical protein
MDLKKNYATDKVAEIAGIEKDFGDGLFIKIARIGNSEYKKFFQKLTKPHQKAIRRGVLSDEVADRLLIEAMANKIVLDWRGMFEGQTEIQYSTENCIRILTEYPDLKDQINEIANEMESFKTEDDEELEKN